MCLAVCRVCIYALTYIQFWPHRNHASTTKKIGYLHVLQFCLSKIFSSWFAFMATVIFVLALDSTCVSSLPRMTYFIDHSCPSPPPYIHIILFIFPPFFFPFSFSTLKSNIYLLCPLTPLYIVVICS